MPYVVTENAENNEFLKRYQNLNITEQDIGEFVAIDNESLHVFYEEIFEEANFYFEEQQLVNEDENITLNEPMDGVTISQTLQAR